VAASVNEECKKNKVYPKYFLLCRPIPKSTVKNFFNRPNEMKIINLDDKFFQTHPPIIETF
jgi:hypothetical protein